MPRTKWGSYFETERNFVVININCRLYASHQVGQLFRDFLPFCRSYILVIRDMPRTPWGSYFETRIEYIVH